MLKDKDFKKGYTHTHICMFSLSLSLNSFVSEGKQHCITNYIGSKTLKALAKDMSYEQKGSWASNACIMLI